MAVALAQREGAAGNDLAERLAADERLGLDRQAVDAVLADPVGFVGTAPRQVEAFARQVEAIAAAHPDAARYRPDRSSSRPAGRCRPPQSPTVPTRPPQPAWRRRLGRLPRRAPMTDLGLPHVHPARSATSTPSTTTACSWSPATASPPSTW